MRLSGITSESIVDGPGLRMVIFTQGCPHKCPHCHNPESWANDLGEEYSTKQIIKMVKKARKNKRGVTFSGGEPFLQAAELAKVAQEAKLQGLDVVTYTGFTYEKLIAMNDEGVRALLSLTDILIDGRYMHDQRDIALKFRGSANQRVIDVAATRKNNVVVLWAG